MSLLELFKRTGKCLPIDGSLTNICHSPSAGITMVSALLSLATKTPVLQNCAMTGEVSLTGKVMPIGGVREKTVAAKRSGVKTLIFPKENRSDFAELPDFIKDGFEVHFVQSYDEVLKVILPSLKFENARTE
jgi:ATP-dependent Lon protease